MRVSFRLAFAIASVVIVVSGTLAYVALHNVGALGSRLESVYDDVFLPFSEADRANNALQIMRIDIYAALHGAARQRATWIPKITAAERDFTAAFEEYCRKNTIDLQPRKQELLREYGALEDQREREQNAIRNINQDYASLKPSITRVLDLLTQGNGNEAASSFETTASPLFDRLDANTSALMQLQIQQSAYGRTEAPQALLATRGQIIAGILFTSVIALLALFIITRMVTVPLQKLTLATEQVTRGDLSLVIEGMGNDEFGRLGRSFNQMVAELNRVQSASRENEQRLIEAQQVANVGSWEWDIIHNKVTWSEELYRIFGLEPNAFGGTYEAYLEHVHPDDKQLVTSMVERAFREKALPEYDTRIIRKDGTERVIRASAAVISDESGKPVKMVGIGQDITERKRIEVELHNARDAALQSARTKSEFLANMSHEIRTPLNGVIGMTELLLDTELAEMQRVFAETIRTSAESLLRIVDDILDLSKIEAGKLRVESTAFNLHGAAETVVDLLSQRAQAKNTRLTLKMDENVPVQVYGDSGRLQQVLMNLVSNAVKFTSDGQVVVHCAVDSQTDTHPVVRFTVTDTGIGISRAAMKNLFQPFSQGDSSTTRKFGGTGLGLVISKQLVELMGGEIGVESEPGRGSAFWFTVRLETRGEDARHEAVESYSDLHGLRVLVIESESSHRKFLMQQTALWGMSFAEADTADSGLKQLQAAALEERPFNAVLLSSQLSDMGGIELARRIKSDAQFERIRVILMSFSDHEAMNVPRDTAIDGYLKKPARPSKLFDCLASAMIRRKPARVEERAPALPQPASQGTLTSALPAAQRHVLVAEDNVVNQTVATLQLRKLGYESDIAGNGKEALEAMSKTPYQIVLMDCQMPDMDGFEATREIRRREGGGHRAVIIAMTASSMDGDREKCIAAGMDDYISKPVKIEELQRALRRWETDTVVTADV